MDDIPTTDQTTGDALVHCDLCGHKSSIAMIFTHLANEHDIHVSAEDIANAQVIDLTEDDGK